MDDLHLLTLLAVRLRSRGDAEAVRLTVGDLVGDASVAIEQTLAAAFALEQLRTRGEERRVSLTAAGAVELAAYLAADTETAGRAELTTAYEAFLPLNREFLAACVGWQDGDVDIDDLSEIVRAAGPVLKRLRELRTRFALYGPRFDEALEQAVTDPRWIDSPLLDSVHTVWFELHEHLLASLGRDRSSER
jgi:hypothetical protein